MKQVDLNNKTALVTGGSLGLGKVVAEKLVASGANVIICSRSAEQAESAVDHIKSQTGYSKIYSMGCDVSQPDQVEKLVSFVIDTFGSIHILVNCAGVYGPKGNSEKVDWEQWTKAIEINLYGSVLSSSAVLPIFKSQNYGKIVQLSGGGATSPLPLLSAYAASKAAIVRYMETLAVELQDFKIDVNCVAPGALNTRLLDEILEAGPELVGKKMYEKSKLQAQTGGESLDLAGDLICFLSSTLSDGLTGKLISAVWDNWLEIGDRAFELSASEALTLRRLNGSAVSMNWIDK